MLEKILGKLYNEIGESRLMVLSTCAENNVTSRMVSVIAADGKFYFQTGNKMRKYQQIKVNPNAALCFDNFQLEGICADIGSPSENPYFTRLYKKHYQSAYHLYTFREDERLIEFTPKYIKRWLYEDGKPYEEILDILNDSYEKRMLD